MPSNGATCDQRPTIVSSAAIEAHFTALMRVALLRRSCARPFATHASHTASLSGSDAGGVHASRDLCDSTEVDKVCPLSSALSVWVAVAEVYTEGSVILTR